MLKRRRVFCSCCCPNLSSLSTSCHCYYYSAANLFLPFIIYSSFIFVVGTAQNLEAKTQANQMAGTPNSSVDSGNKLQLDAHIGAQLMANASSSSDEQKSKNSISTDLLCNAQENSMCENARACRRKENGTDFECVCRRGHAGKFCQFSLFPRNCADAFAFHEVLDDFLEEDQQNGGGGGVWQLDVDGSAPLAPTFAECKMINGEVITVVSNNVPPGGAVVRTVDGHGPADAQNVFFPISYRLFSSSQLNALISRSYICKQNIRFDCEHSPLGFKDNRTWLELVSHDGGSKPQRQIGTHQQFSCACRNKELYGCGRDNPALACYCDDLSQPSAVDQATLYNASSGVSAVFFRATETTTIDHQTAEGGEAQNFTLGQLECSGEAGTSPLHGALVTLRSPSAGFGTGKMDGQWRQLEFDFRTGQPDIDQFVAGWDPADDGLQMKISLRAGYHIELLLSHQASIEEQAEKSAESGAADAKNDAAARQQQKRGIRREMTVSIESQRPLNDLFWHRVVVEVFRGEIRFSVDRLNAFQPLSFPFATSTKFTIGGDEIGNNGFVGCIGNFQIDQKLQNWHQQLAQKEKDEDFRVVAGCLELCAAEENKCEQGSKCVEHFDTETTSCACKLPRIHYGEHCEKNVNDNSSVTFRGGSSAFLRFMDLPISVLHSDAIFSIKTDQRRALLLYEHDHADNFVQIHLADEHRIVLTVNNLTTIRSCSIVAAPAKTFNDMRWHQLILERNAGIGDDGTTLLLYVDDEHCAVGPVLLLNNDVSPPALSAADRPMPAVSVRDNGDGGLPNDDHDDNGKTVTALAEDDDTILPPAPPVPPEKVRPFHILFVGGMPRARRTLRQKRQQRMPVYVSNVPQLRGCIRGLLVDGEKVDMREAIAAQTLAAHYKHWRDSLQIGCEHMPCDQLNCQNGGHCSVSWRSAANGPRTSQCDCTRSSFIGTNCTEDVGLAFVGHSAVVFDMSEPKRFAFLHQSERQTLSFAFFASKNGGVAGGTQKYAQQMATIIFEDGKEFHVVMDKNGTLFVGIFEAGRRRPIDMRHFAQQTFNDGFRHHFRVHFLANAIKFELFDSHNGTRQIWTMNESEERLNLANARQFYFGGPKREGGNSKNAGAETASMLDTQSSESGSVEGRQSTPAATNRDQSAADDANADIINRIIMSKLPLPPENNADSANNLLADAMRDILARSVVATTPVGGGYGGHLSSSNLNLHHHQIDDRPNLEQFVRHDDDGDENSAKKWPQHIDHFTGCISNALIMFERDAHVLTFSPFLYYLQKSELLHRNVFTVPPSPPSSDNARQQLAPFACGQFKVPQVAAKKPRRNVTFPVWEAPFGPIPFHDNGVKSAEKLIKNSRQAAADEATFGKGNNAFGGHWWWLLAALLFLLIIILSVLCLCLITFLCRRATTTTIHRHIAGGRTYVLQKAAKKQHNNSNHTKVPMSASTAATAIKTTNGPIKKRRFGSKTDSMEPIQLAQHKRFFPLEGSFCGTPPIVTPSSAPLLLTDEQHLKPAEMLHYEPVNMFLSSSSTNGPLAPARQSALFEHEHDSAATASSSTAYFTAQEEQYPENASSSSPAISFKSLDDYQQRASRSSIASGDDEESTIIGGGNAFDENAPELFDERTLQMSTALSSSSFGGGGSSNCSLIGDSREQILPADHIT